MSSPANSASARAYDVADWRLDRPDVRVRMVRDGDHMRYAVEGELPKSVPPLRASKYLAREQAIAIYRWMLLTRRLEQALETLYKQSRLHGGVYSSLGHEAVACASACALAEDDWIAPMIRNNGSVLVRGFAPAEIIMQLMGKAAAPTGGTDGIHWGDLRRNTVAPISTLGDLLPVLSGVALGARLQGREIAVMTYIGDGGQSTGVVYEALNFAAVQRLGLVLLVENNQFAYSTPTSLQFAVKDLAERAIAYGIPGIIVDGTDACQVYDAAYEACRRGRRGEGPTLIEAKLMRRSGHGIHDPFTYVPRELLAFWAKRDPISRMEMWLVREKKWLSTAENERLLADIERQVAEEREQALAAPMPDPARPSPVYCDGCHNIEFRYGTPRYPGERTAVKAKQPDTAVHLK